MACYVSDEDDDLPPLEDMSELLEQAKRIQRSYETQTEHKPSASTPPTAASSPPSSDVTSDGMCSSSRNHGNQARSEVETKQARQTLKSSGSFGGMKKGFLSGGSKKKSIPLGKSSASPSKSVQNETEAVPSPVGSPVDIPVIRPKEGSGNDDKQKYLFDDVQEALRGTAPLLKNKEWLNDDLLADIEKHPRLAKQIGDPRLSQAINYFQRDSKQAMEVYKDDAEVQQFFKDFCSLLGSHFTSMDSSPHPSSTPPTPDTIKIQDDSKKTDVDIKVRSSTNPKQATADDEAKMQQILTDPEIREILTDNQVQRLFEALRSNQDQGQRILQSASPELQSKINKLIQAGLLGFAS